MVVSATLPRLFLSALAVACLGLAGCQGRERSESPPEAGDVVVARVNGVPVWTSDVKREAVAQGLIGEGEPLDPSSEQFRRTTDEVIDRRLLAAEAARRKLDKDPAVQRRLAAARERILADLVVDSTVTGAISEPAIRSLYQEQVRLSRQTEEIRARQIVVATQPEAEAVRKLLASGGSFEALAMERSLDAATRFNGGDLGYFTADIMPDSYEAALKTAKAGQTIGPFQVEGGWALVRIEDRRPEQPISLEAARPQIVRFLTYDQVRDLLEKLRGQAKVQTFLKTTPDVPGQPREPASGTPTPEAAPKDKDKDKPRDKTEGTPP
ncbi:MAG: peptidylprolyl isomerase [Phenylobacterium sp.]|nr:peptidylprolyl isomerase [Phenylobacterium sp.]MCA3736652.1 peptidylprolyl isomerase [Phenylobacterium sp.]MCA3745707.1 peptidylprolyl isomerase [Phenylobacterium sp.]MCA4916157.1 peptidylprolyl isomerase [Phenylobacterium sp.]MCA6241252.1 peptidylprolyl isomerase [Phenylobacterium sp.]